MTDEADGREPPRTPTSRGRRSGPQELELADGARLVLGVDGWIDQVDDQGSTSHRWRPADPKWPDQAIRFRLHPQARRSHGGVRRVHGTKPPRWQLASDGPVT